MKKRNGFTLIEVMIALVLLTVAVLGIASATGRFLHVVTDGRVRSAALQLAEDRIQTVMMDPDYGGLDTLYAGVEADFPGLDGYSRQTVVDHIGGSGQTTNHKRIVVSVLAPGLEDPVVRSATVAAP
jgi:prepilin-type N-terminal cleavage/methylation domain-containing protein